MKSISTATPVGVVNTVSSTKPPSRYDRVTVTSSPAGAISQRPLSGEPRRAAKQAGLSKRGQHNQSTDPLRPTSAQVLQSPMTA